MLKHKRFKTAALAGLGAVLVLNGCVSSNSNAAPAASLPNVSGQYAGTVTDSVSGAATAIVTLAEHGSAAGGAMVVGTGGSAKTMQLSLLLTASNPLSGTLLFDNGVSTPCTFATTATYANNGASSATLTGTYSAVSNCAGETGTYALTQQCTDIVAVAGAPRKSDPFPPQC